MFIGHYAAAFAAKKVAPQVSFGTLLLASQFLDLLWPIFLLLDLEHVRIAPGITAFTPLDFYDYPITHSLIAVLGWSVAFAAVWWFRHRRTVAALVLGGCVLSHWLLDVISHRPDMPLSPGVDRYVGLALWNSVSATIMVELALFAAGLLMYLSATKGKRRSVGFYTFVAFTLLLYAGNAKGTPPPNVNALAWFGLSQWLMVPWAYWIDRRRASPVNGATRVAQEVRTQERQT